jgi:hypothetical protein
MTAQPTRQLSDGGTIPLLGLGVWQKLDDLTYEYRLGDAPR